MHCKANYELKNLIKIYINNNIIDLILLSTESFRYNLLPTSREFSRAQCAFHDKISARKRTLISRGKIKQRIKIARSLIRASLLLSSTRTLYAISLLERSRNTLWRRFAQTWLVIRYSVDLLFLLTGVLTPMFT